MLHIIQKHTYCLLFITISIFSLFTKLILGHPECDFHWGDSPPEPMSYCIDRAYLSCSSKWLTDHAKCTAVDLSFWMFTRTVDYYPPEYLEMKILPEIGSTQNSVDHMDAADVNSPNWALKLHSFTSLAKRSFFPASTSGKFVFTIFYKRIKPEEEKENSFINLVDTDEFSELGVLVTHPEFKTFFLNITCLESVCRQLVMLHPFRGHDLILDMLVYGLCKNQGWNVQKVLAETVISSLADMKDECSQMVTDVKYWQICLGKLSLSYQVPAFLEQTWLTNELLIKHFPMLTTYTVDSLCMASLMLKISLIMRKMCLQSKIIQPTISSQPFLSFFNKTAAIKSNDWERMLTPNLARCRAQLYFMEFINEVFKNESNPFDNKELDITKIDD